MNQGHSLLIATAIAALAGCSNAAPSVPKLLPGAVSNDSADAHQKVVETLKARRIVVKVQSCVSGTGEATFTAKGKAKGRVRGKFTASGVWNFFSSGSQTVWTFSESFKIKGKHPTTGTVTGNGTDAIATCKTFGPVNNKTDLTFHLGNATGAATTTLLKNGATLVQQMQ